MQKKGFTLIEVLIGISLMLVIFLGVYGLIHLGFKMVGQSKARVTATSLANEKMELARNLTYLDVGTEGGIPHGVIPETEVEVRNGISFEIKTTIFYIDDPFDGLGELDTLPLDYKRVKVKVSWQGFLGGDVFLQTDVAPKGIETTGEGGTIAILVFDSNGQSVPQADIHVENSAVVPAIDAHYLTNNDGLLNLSGAPVCGTCYKITATKASFSTDRTYIDGELIRGEALTPLNDKQYASVMLNRTTPVDLSIDRLSTLTVQTIKYSEEKIWSDPFDDESKISDLDQAVASTTISGVVLEEEAGQYLSPGYVNSVTITPTSLVEWGRLNWTQEAPLLTNIRYQLLYSTSSNWELIPDEDLTVAGVKNSDGFTIAPIDLTELDTTKYRSVRIKAGLSTDEPSLTPTLDNWEVTWFSSDTSVPIGNIDFTMTGGKILGTDSEGNPIYKYLEDLSTDTNGTLTISEVEWDDYEIEINGATEGYDIANSLPPQPVIIDADTSPTTILKLAVHQTNTLLVTIENSGRLPLAGATVRLTAAGYDKQKITSDSGQVFFSPLNATTYDLEVTLSDFQVWTGTVAVSGQSHKTATLVAP